MTVKMKTLSICIPTYNRSTQLEELVKSLLEVESADFEVVITNNCSTDNTLSMLNGINDERLVVYNNTSSVPAYYNMILSIFNAQGKYALYCNDRDVIFTERLIDFIEFLKNHEYSYLHIKKCYGVPSYKLVEYEKGFDSLLNHPYSTHPTGMVFNVELIKKHLNKDNYHKYIQDIYTWCFLCRDVVIYEKSAEYDNYLWDERPSIYKVQSASGSIFKRQLFFDTEKIIEFMRSVIKHLIGNPNYALTAEQEKSLILNVFKSYNERLLGKKMYYADKRECAHYGIKPRFISYFEMKQSYKQYYDACDNTLKESIYYEDLYNKWSEIKDSFLKTLFKKCLICDKSIIMKKIRRTFNSQYRY